MSSVINERRHEIHSVLSRPRLILGVDHKLAMLNMIAAAEFVLILGMPWMAPGFLVSHLVLAYATKRDPMIRPVYMRYMKQKDRYEPWPRTSGANQRPIGWGRGFLC